MFLCYCVCGRNLPFYSPWLDFPTCLWFCYTCPGRAGDKRTLVSKCAGIQKNSEGFEGRNRIRHGEKEVHSSRMALHASTKTEAKRDQARCFPESEPESPLTAIYT